MTVAGNVLPLAITTMPADMPLAEIDLDYLGYGTRIKFDPCGYPDFVYGTECKVDADHLSVQIWPEDRYCGVIQEDRTVPVDVDGKDGLYDELVQ